MTKIFAKWILWLWVIVGVQGMFAFLLDGSFRYNFFARHDNWDAVLNFILLILILSGVVVIWRLLKVKIWLKILLGLIYSIAMYLLSIVIALMIDCSWGDCL